MLSPARPPARPAPAPLARPNPPYCKHVGVPRLVRVMIVNGSWQVRKQCGACGELFGSALKRVPDMDSLPIVDNGYRNPPCEVHGCNEPMTTNHHWLPRHIAQAAGLACDQWPQAYLCHKHHMIWHKLVTPGLVSEADKLTMEVR